MPPRVRQAMCEAKGAEPARLHERSRIAAIGLRAPGARRIHRGEVRIRDKHLVPEPLQVPRHPLTLRTRLEQNARPRPMAEHRSESLARRGDPALLDRPVVVPNAELTLALVQREPYHIHGWPPGVCLAVRR